MAYHEWRVMVGLNDTIILMMQVAGQLDALLIQVFLTSNVSTGTA